MSITEIIENTDRFVPTGSGGVNTTEGERLWYRKNTKQDFIFGIIEKSQNEFEVFFIKGNKFKEEKFLSPETVTFYDTNTQQLVTNTTGDKVEKIHSPSKAGEAAHECLNTIFEEVDWETYNVTPPWLTNTFKHDRSNTF